MRRRHFLSGRCRRALGRFDPSPDWHRDSRDGSTRRDIRRDRAARSAATSRRFAQEYAADSPSKHLSTGELQTDLISANLAGSVNINVGATTFVVNMSALIYQRRRNDFHQSATHGAWSR